MKADGNNEKHSRSDALTKGNLPDLNGSKEKS